MKSEEYALVYSVHHIDVCSYVLPTNMGTFWFCSIRENSGGKRIMIIPNAGFSVDELEISSFKCDTVRAVDQHQFVNCFVNKPYTPEKGHWF